MQQIVVNADAIFFRKRAEMSWHDDGS